MTQQTGVSPLDLIRLANGFQISQALSVCVELGIPDRIGEGEAGVHELAVAAGAHEDALYRLLRALATVGVLDERPERRFALTPLGRMLRSDVPLSAAGWVRFIGRPYYWNAWSNLVHSIRTGENAFRAREGVDVWRYRAAHPEENEIFNAAMAAVTGLTTLALLGSYDFGRHATLCDIGGGTGAFLAAVLARHPAVRGIVFDQAHVAAGARQYLERAGVADRCTIVAGDMFEGVPPGADAYAMKSILHDWEDAECLRILAACRRASGAATRLLVMDRVVGPPNEDPHSKFIDLNMLVSPGGRERTEAEWRALLAAGGFRIERIHPAGPAPAIIEALPG